MKLRELIELVGAQWWGLAGGMRVPAEPGTPKPFEPLTRDESIAVLDDAVQWLVDETRTALALPDGPSKDLRLAELRGRDKSMVRDFERLMKKQK